MEAEKEGYDSDGGKHDDGSKAEIKHYIINNGISKGLDDEGLGDELEADTNHGGLENALDDDVSFLCDSLIYYAKCSLNSAHFLSHLWITLQFVDTPSLWNGTFPYFKETVVMLGRKSSI